MGISEIANLIVNMTFAHASDDELKMAIHYSIDAIDSMKHYGIDELAKKYGLDI